MDRLTRALLTLPLLALWGCGAPEPEPEGPPAPPAASEPEPAASEPAAPEPAPPAEPVPSEPAPPAEPEPAPPAPPGPAIAMAPPPAASEPEPAPEPGPGLRPRPPAPEPAAPAADSLAAAVPDLEELRLELTFVDEVPPLSEPDAGSPPGLAPPGAGPAGPARFVRLREVWLGGELDAAGDEEVRVDASQGEAQAVILQRTFDLGSSLTGLRVDDVAPWVELGPPDAQGRLLLELVVVEEDETEDEPMTGTAEAVALPLDRFGAAEARLELALEPIVGVEVHLLGPNREIRLEGVKAELGLVEAPRRQEADEAARRLVAEAFAPLLGAGEPADPAACLALARAAGRAGDEAMTRAARSTDTWVRAALPPLAAEARRLAVVAAAVAQADAPVVRGGQVELARVLKGLPPAEAARPEAVEALARARGLAAPLLEGLDPAELASKAAEAAAAGEALDEVSLALLEQEESSSELGAVRQSLGALEQLLRRAARGVELTPVLRRARAGLVARVEGLR